MNTSADNLDAYRLGQLTAQAGGRRQTAFGCGDPDCADCAAIRASFFMGYDDFKAKPAEQQKAA